MNEQITMGVYIELQINEEVYRMKPEEFAAGFHTFLNPRYLGGFSEGMENELRAFLQSYGE